MTAVVALRQVPKGNGAALLALGILVVGVSVALYVGASRHRLGRSGQPHFDTAVKWTWGLLVGATGVLCVVAGIYVLVTGS